MISWKSVYSKDRKTLFELPMLYWLLWVAIIILWMGRFVTPFLSIYLISSLHETAGITGVVASMYGFGGILASLFAGTLSDRFGRQIMILASELGAAILLIALSLIANPTTMGVTLFIYGAVSSAAGPAISAYIADIVPSHDRQRAYTLQVWAMNFGFAAGPVIAGRLVLISYSLIFYVEAAVLVAVSILLALIFVRGGWKRKNTMRRTDTTLTLRDNYRTVFTDRQFLVFVMLMIGYTLAYFQSTSGLPMAMTQLGLSSSDYSILLSINGVILCMLQIPTMKLFERIGNAGVLVCAMALTAMGYAVQILAGNWPGFALATVLWSIGELGTFPIASTIVSIMAPAQTRGTYQGIYNLTWSLSQGCASLVGGFVVGTFGGRTLWIICTVMLTVVTVGLWVTRHGRERSIFERTG